MSDFILYNYFRSSTSYRVRIALNIKGVSYTYKPIHLLKNGGEQHTAEYRSINPMGGVPTLVHKGKNISQSMAIIEYLDEILPQRPLFAKDSYLRAKIRQFCENINCDLHPLNNLKVFQYLEKEFHLDEAKKQKWIQHWNHEGLAACEKMLEQTSGTFCFSNDLTAADVFLTAHCFSALRFNVNLKLFPNIFRIQEKCFQLPEFHSAHPYRQVDTPDELKII